MLEHRTPGGGPLGDEAFHLAAVLELVPYGVRMV
jgi:hypothetical protein